MKPTVETDLGSLPTKKGIRPTDPGVWKRLVGALVVLWGLAVAIGCGIGQHIFSPGLALVLKESVAGSALLVAVLLASFGVGMPLVRRLLPSASDAETLLFGTGIGLGVWSYVILGLGVTGLLWPAIAWTLLAAGNLWALYLLWRGAGRQAIVGCNGCTHPPYPQRALSAIIPKQLQALDWFLILVALCGMLFSLLAYALIPPLSWDEVAYHLAIPKIYVEQHQIVNIPYIAYSNSPFNMEMLYTLALLLNSDILPHLLMFAISLMSSLGMLLFCAKHFETRTGLLALAIYWSMQSVRILSGTALVEIGLGFYTWLAFYAFTEWLIHRSSKWLIATALTSGLVAGTKLTGATIPVMLFLALCFTLAWQWKTQLRVPTLLRTLLPFGLVVLALVSPWYLKSYIYTRNPIWPFLNSLFGGQYWDAVGDSHHLGYLRITNVKFSIGNLLLGPWRLTTNPVRFGGYGPGVLLLWLAPFAPVLADRASRKLVYPLTILCVTFYGIWFLLSHQARFLAPVVPALCVLSATAGRRLMQKDRLSLVFQCMVVVMMAAELPCWYPDQVQLWGDRLGYLGGRVSREEFLRSHIEPFSAFEYCNQRLPADARILLFPYENRGYYLDRPYVWGNLITQRYIRFEQFKDAHALWQGLQALGVTHILDRPAFTHATFARGLALPSWEHDRRTMDELERDYAVLLFQKDSTLVYELRK